jgi:hypothetical protein
MIWNNDAMIWNKGATIWNNDAMIWNKGATIGIRAPALYSAKALLTQPPLIVLGRFRVE